MNHFKLAVSGLTLACTVGIANADFSSSPFALGGNTQYLQSNTVHYNVDGTDIGVSFDFTMTDAPHLPPGEGTGPSFGSSSADYSMGISINSLPPGDPYSGGMNCSYFDVFANLSADGKTKSYDTEMLSLDLQVSHPMGDMLIRESPTLASLGHYEITSLGSGKYHIESFFDIFMEISLDDGATWIAGDEAGHFAIVPVPAPGAIALLGLFGFIPTRRRR